MSSRPDGGLIWVRPEPGVRKPRFSRDKIAAAALEIADTEGFEAVSMRRIATELGAATMTLYNYVRTKDDLVALMHDAIMGEVIIPAGELPAAWREAVTLIAGRVRHALVRHPWALGALQEAQPGPNAMRRFEQFLAAVSGGELSTAQKFDLLTVVNAYVFGNALITVESRRRAEDAAADPALVEEMFSFAATQLASGEFPHTAKLMAEGGPGTAPSSGAARGSDSDGGHDSRANAGPPMDEQGLDEQFQRGLDALLDGLTARFAAASPA